MLNFLTKTYINVTEGVRRFKQDERGVTAIEYGLIAVAVAVMIVAVFYSDTGFIKSLQSKFSELATTVSEASISK